MADKEQKPSLFSLVMIDRPIKVKTEIQKYIFAQQGLFGTVNTHFTHPCLRTRGQSETFLPFDWFIFGRQDKNVQMRKVHCYQRKHRFCTTNTYVMYNTHVHVQWEEKYLWLCIVTHLQKCTSIYRSIYKFTIGLGTKQKCNLAIQRLLAENTCNGVGLAAFLRAFS